MTLIQSKPEEGWMRLPPYRVDKIYDQRPLAEYADGFLTKRGEWEKLQEACDYGKHVKIGVGDTGIDKTHAQSGGDLEGVEGKDFTGSRNGFYDVHSHGSHTTGHILGRSNGGGMIGLCPQAKGAHFKCLGDSGSGSTRGISSGIRWAVDVDCKIINMSLGGGFSQDIENACREAGEAGVLVFASMGNSGTRGSGHPGNSRYTFGIAAVDYNRKIAGFSSRGKSAYYSGYGVQVYSCVTGGRYGRMSGTSMSSPDQAGIAGLILSYMAKNNMRLPETMEEYESIVRPGVIDLGRVGRDIEYGFGFIDIWKVLSALGATDPKPEPEPEPGEAQLMFAAALTSDGVKFSSDGDSATFDGKKYTA